MKSLQQILRSQKSNAASLLMASVWATLSMFVVQDVSASSAQGLTGRTLKSLAAGNGCTVGCHASGGGQAGTVAISGPASLAAGQTGTYTITNTSSPATASQPMGFDVATSDATAVPALLNGTTANMLYDSLSGELVHKETTAGVLTTLAQTNASGVGTYTFTYTMPTGAATSSSHTLFGTSRVGYVSWNETSTTVTTSAPFTALVGGSSVPGAFTYQSPNGTAVLSTSGGAGTGAVTYTSDNTAVCTVSSTTLTLVAAGSCIISATKAADSTTSSLSSTVAVTVNKANQAALTALINLSSAAATFTYQSPNGTAALSTSGGTGTGGVTYSSSNTAVCTVASATLTLAGAGTCTITATKAADTNYNQTTATIGVTVNKANQAALTALINLSSAAATFTYQSPNGTAALSTSGGTGTGGVTYSSSNTAVCTVASATLTLAGAGTCTITATKAADTNYNQTTATIGVTVNKANQAALTALINLSSAAATFTYQSPNGTAALSTSGGTGTGGVTYSSSNTAVCTVASATLTLAGAGTCTITATKAADTNYNQTTATIGVTVGQATQVITFAALVGKVLGDPAFAVSATGGASGQAVTFSSATTAVCSVSGSTVTIAAVGACTIIAAQAGDTNYSAATPVSQSFQVAPPILFVSAASRKSHGAGTYDLPITTGIPLSGAVTIEPRAIGSGHRIVFTFSKNVTVAGTGSASVGSVVSVTASGAEVVVVVTGVTDRNRSLITLSGVDAGLSAGLPAGLTVSAPIGFLLGDVNQSGTVDATDVTALKVRSGLVVGAGNFLFDVNVSGAINSADVSAIKSRQMQSLLP